MSALLDVLDHILRVHQKAMQDPCQGETLGFVRTGSPVPVILLVVHRLHEIGKILFLLDEEV